MDAASNSSLDDREAAYERFVRSNLKRNYAAHYLHGMLGMTGFRLVNAPTFMPAYLHALSGSKTVVGLGLALGALGSVFAPIVGASQIEHRTRVLPVAVVMGSLMRVQILGFDFHFRELTLTGAYGRGTAFKRVLPVLNRVGAADLVTDRYPLARIAEAFAHAAAGRGLKTAITPGTP